VSAISGATGAANLVSSFIKETSINQEIDVAILKKGRDVEKATGEAALSLIESVTAQRIDVHV